MVDKALFTYLSIVVGYFACFGSLFVTAWVREFAEKRGFVDRPDGGRKSQKSAVALGGGAAVFISTFVAILMVAFIYADVAKDRMDQFDGSLTSLIGLGCAAALLCLVGLYDDLYNMRGGTKLIWQFVAAFIVVAQGSDRMFDSIDLLGYPVPLMHLGIPIAIVWIVASVNSLNLIDGMDGLAATIGFIFSVSIGCMAIFTNNWLEAIVAFAMAGSLLGFLRHNWPPAKIYLGDSGSMLIGVVLGTLAIRCELKSSTSLAIATPLAIFAIPFIDSAAALIRRKLTGRSLYSTDRGHIHHRLLTQNFSNRQALFLISGLCALTCVGSMLGVYFKRPFGIVSFGIVLAILVGNRLFGHSELMLLNNRIAGFGRRFFPGEQPSSSSVRLQGTLQWEEVWKALIESAESFNLMKIRLNLYLPKLHEDFFATWQRRSRTRADRRWTAEVPLIVDNAVVGTLSVTGVQDGGSVAPILSEFAELIKPLESELEDVLRQHGVGNEETNEQDPASDSESGSESDSATSPDEATDQEQLPPVDSASESEPTTSA